MIKKGGAAPKFALTDGKGKKVKLSDFKGKKVVLYFYPKDMTPGCTVEACDFRDTQRKLKTAGAVILGISPDGEASHAKFSAKYKLNFTLLSDPEKVVAKAYGVWQKKSMYGREYMGIVRSTFLINGKGKIEEIWNKVKVKNHVDEVLEAVKR